VFPGKRRLALPSTAAGLGLEAHRRVGIPRGDQAGKLLRESDIEQPASVGSDRGGPGRTSHRALVTSRRRSVETRVRPSIR